MFAEITILIFLLSSLVYQRFSVIGLSGKNAFD
nr:MAG TPA: hypothetical protein [Caudoviricetes sp.]